MEAPWSEFKKVIQDRNLSIQYITVNSNYYLKAIDGNLELECILPIGVDNSDTNDFENNYKISGNKSFTDIDGTLVIRSKAAKKGWTYSVVPIELTTAKLNSCYSKNFNNSDRPGVTYKIYDANDTEITVTEQEVNAVKTVIDYEPTFDYEIVGGSIQQKIRPVVPIRVWVVAVPDLPTAYGGSKEMVGGINMMFIDPADKVQADGRASKLLNYSATYHSNKLRFILLHSAGVQHDLMILLEIYKA